MIEHEGLELTADFIRRMRNWARAMAGGGISPVRAMDYGTQIDGGYRELGMPILDGEAMDTEAALATVPMRYQQAVRQYWSFEGRSWRWHGAHRNVHHETFRVWVIKGHDLLRPEFARRAALHRAVSRANAATQAQRGLNAA